MSNNSTPKRAPKQLLVITQHGELAHKEAIYVVNTQGDAFNVPYRSY